MRRGGSACGDVARGTDRPAHEAYSDTLRNVTGDQEVEELDAIRAQRHRVMIVAVAGRQRRTTRTRKSRTKE